MPGFEIAGYDRATLESFSTRRREALAWMAQRNLDYTSERMRQAVLYTRKSKEEPERRKLEEAWGLRVRELDLVLDWEAARGRGRAPRRPAPAPSALMIAWRAVEHLEERHTNTRTMRC